MDSKVWSKLPNLISLSLAENDIVNGETVMRGLGVLSRLDSLDLSDNRLRSMKDAHKMIGNVKTLLLSRNRLTTTQGLDHLYGLERLALDWIWRGIP